MTYEEWITKTALSDDRYMVLTAENRAPIRNLPHVLGDRFVDTGITEQALIGVATGLALRGRIPIVHGLSPFLTLRAYEFIRTDVGMSNLPVKLVGTIPGFLSEGNGPTHQSLEDVSLMRSIPNMMIFCPADEQDMILGLQKIFPHPSPWYIRHNPLPATIKHAPFEIGKAEVIAEGREVTFLVYGMLFEQALVAQHLLKQKGMSVGLVNVRTIKPIDEETILTVGHQTSWIVTLEDHFLIGGLFSVVAELFLKHGLLCRVLPLGLKERYFHPGYLPEPLHQEKLLAEQIVQTILFHLRES